MPSFFLNRMFLAFLIILVLGGGLSRYIYRQENRLPLLEIYVFPMKTGRSMLVRTPDDTRVLIDGGPNSSVIREISKILPFYSRRIDYLVATNSESKNISGLIDVLRRYDISKLYIPSITLGDAIASTTGDLTYQILLDEAKSRNIALDFLGRGERVRLGGSTVLNILFPVKDDGMVYNRSSLPELLFELALGDFRLIFLGNASNKIQKYIARSPAGLNTADILLTSQSALPANLNVQLMKKIKPDYLIFSQSVANKDSMADISLAGNGKIGADSRPKKKLVDPLSYIDESRRFNIKKSRTLKITATGAVNEVEVEDQGIGD